MNQPDDEDNETRKLSSGLSRSIGSEKLTDSLATIGDASLNLATEALGGFPVIGAFVNAFRAGSSVRKELEFTKMVRFLEGVSEASDAERKRFTDKLQAKGKLVEFGENILLLLSRLDDMSKPTIVGRVLAAHIKGHMELEKAMRLAAIIDRCYAEDLAYLRTFTPGVQREGTDIAAMLFSVGLLANVGIDGGTIGDAMSGGVVYDLNEYGKLLLKYGLKE